MWEPSDWNDIVAAFGTLAEGQTLDFKNAAALATTRAANDEVAKDIAAMSVGGGVIGYGIDEVNEIATSAGGVQIAGQANRIHQIIGTRVTPPVSVVVRPIEDPSTPGEGVVIVLVPPSVNAPHYCNERYPVRSGTTTRNLTEREIADLYLRREAVIAEQAGDGEPAAAPPPAWFTASGLDMTDVSVMRVTVAPIGPSRLGYRLMDQLREAAVAAEASLGSILWPVPSVPGAFTTWRPFEARGFTSGREEVREGFHLRSRTFAATFLYATGFTVLMTCPVRVDGYKYAYEHLWASDLIGVLALAGRFYDDNSAVSLVRADVRLSELNDAHPGPNQGWFPGNPISLPAYHEHAVIPVTELAAAPVDAAADLLDRFFAAILPHGPDLRGRLGIAE